MSVENVRKFYEAVSQDKGMQQKFIDLSRKYKSDTVDEARVDSIVELDIVPFAKKLGYDFTVDDLKAFGAEMEKSNMNCALSEEEMQAVAGGIFGCIICGGGDKYETDGRGGCIFIGTDSTGNMCIIFGYSHVGRTKE